MMASTAGTMIAPALARSMPAGGQRLAGTTKPDDGIEAALSEALTQRSVAGATICVTHAEQTVLARGYGRANFETATPMTANSILRIGSLTKQFAAAAAIRLAALGKVDLDAPVSGYLPDFVHLAPFTLLELMHQTAGLHSDEDKEPSVVATPEHTQVELAAQIAAQSDPFDFAPGTAWLYSNANYIVLGAVIEQVTGKPLARAMTDLVFNPLGLNKTAMDDAKDVVPGRASGYNATGEDEPAFVHGDYLDPSQAGGAGAMRSTVGDLCRWHHLLLHNALFDRHYTELMLAPGRLRDGRLSSANRHSPDDAVYGDTEYACGLLVSGSSEPQPNIMHYGFISGFSSLLQTWTEPRVTLAALFNTDMNPAVPFRAIRKAVIQSWVEG
ncbi:serine hydrolase domain-containing protein [Tsuneonella mangrovi]|uniref:serine hydrolase domain-containing protein n=1 Tax=Tsuneonella mangrovi TaxID=1982042 RepID=UPI001470F246|nr:serine hydrolase domain-containing protein [Tsuneonella mangrovi]